MAEYIRARTDEQKEERWQKAMRDARRAAAAAGTLQTNIAERKRSARKKQRLLLDEY
jgi:hypothetical protein